MKIPLNVGGQDGPLTKAQQAKLVERDVLAAKGGDWNAKNNLVRTFMPLLISLAEKRSSDRSKINSYIEAGKDGLIKATKKYKKGAGAEHFQLFALDFIEKNMDGAGAGFFSRLFKS